MRISSFIKDSFHFKGKSIESSLIKLIGLLLFMLFISTILLYYSTMQAMYSEQLEISNNSIIDQVGISFETVMKQITDSIYKIPLYDTDLLQLIQSYQNEGLYKIKIYKKLDSFILGNDYLFSSYLYLPDRNLVFSSEFGNSFTADNFYDKAAIDAAEKEKVIVLDPRLINKNADKKLLISVVSPVPLSSGDTMGILVLNIDANRLFYDILKKIKATSNMNFYVYNRDNTIIISKDDFLLFKTIPDDKHGDKLPFQWSVINKSKNFTYLYYSKALNWNFVLEISIKPTNNFWSRLYTFILFFILFMILSLIIIIWIVKNSTKSINKVMLDYNEKLWRDFLTDNYIDPEIIQNQLSLDSNKLFGYGSYAIIAVQINKQNIDQNYLQQQLVHIMSFIGTNNMELIMKPYVINKNLAAVIINYNQECIGVGSNPGLFLFAELIYNNLDAALKQEAYVSISLPQDSIHMLPKSYRECIEAFCYKIVSNSHIIQYSVIKGRKDSFEYPYEMEKQLINNIIVGNVETCRILLDKFFSNLTDPSICLPDSELKNYIFQLQASILRNISGLPMPIKIETSMNVLNLFDFHRIKIEVLDFIEKIISEVSKKDENEELVLYKKIFDYIDKNYMSERFNLNSASDNLNLNRHYLAKIIKENFNENFNDYINKKRISLAKQLLNDKNMPIDAIAQKVGFNYSHYFIKVFKNYEGITPGQYKEKLLKN